MGAYNLATKSWKGRSNRPFLFKFITMKPKKDKLHKMTVGKQREKQVEQGFFDGRFVQRAEESKKVFKRKEKHPKKDV
jgi:hypothetical protein